MKKFAKKTIFQSLASACFLGSTCCSAMLFGQQLEPMNSQSVGEDLPPIVSASQPARSYMDEQLPPIVKAASQTERVSGELPPVVSVNEMMNTQAGGESPTVVKGSNYPSDAQARIAEFIASNRVDTTQLANPGYAEQQAQFSANMYKSGFQQDASPSDLPTQPVPVPNIVPAPGGNQMAPSIGGQMVAPAPSYEASPSIVHPSPDYSSGQDYSIAPAYPQGGEQVYASPGSGNYFEADVQGGYGPENVDYGSIENTFDCCGFICDARNYFIVDSLYWEREDGVFRASNMNAIDDFDHSWGGKITWGSRRDCTRGFEASYMQFDPWLAVSNQNDGAGSLIGTIFGSAGGFAPPTFSAFRNSTFIEQFHKTDLHSLELNKTWWGSDVAKAFIGARYIYFDDEFHLSSANAAGEQGIYTIDTTNNMFGAHIGGELLYDIGYRLSFSFSGKLGAYADFYKGRTGLLNAGTQYLFNSQEDTDLAYSAELGVTARYKLSANTRLRVGYDAMALLDIREVQSNFSTVVTPLSGSFYNDGDALFHGASLGFEIYR